MSGSKPVQRRVKPDYERIALQAVEILLHIGCYGLHLSRQRELWQCALDLDRQLHPSLPTVTVWTPEEGDIHPPRRAERVSKKRSVS